MRSLHGAFEPAFISRKLPIFIDIESVDSVLVGLVLSAWRASDSCSPSAYIISMNLRWDRQEEEARRGPWPNDDGEKECYSLINGCQIYDVDWTKISVRKLYPRSYSPLSDSDLWRTVCRRPPKVSSIL